MRKAEDRLCDCQRADAVYKMLYQRRRTDVSGKGGLVTLVSSPDFSQDTVPECDARLMEDAFEIYRLVLKASLDGGPEDPVKFVRDLMRWA